MTPAHRAAADQSLASLRVLHGLGFSLDTPDAEGKTPAHYARCTDVVVLLHGLGVKLDALDLSGRSPAEHINTERSGDNNNDMMKTLHRLGVSLEVPNLATFTPDARAALAALRRKYRKSRDSDYRQQVRNICADVQSYVG
jgi:hypothetical protein